MRKAFWTLVFYLIAARRVALIVTILVVAWITLTASQATLATLGIILVCDFAGERN